MNLRTKIGQHIARAIKSPDKDNPQDVHNWLEITTDRIINEFISELPEPIDIDSKYELGKDGGVYVSVVAPETEGSEEANGEQLTYLARYSDDRGYNRYRQDLVMKIHDLYKSR